ncbi:MAG: NAD(P)-dependent oxidoreductase [Desulfobacterium sp.]|jgi:3-hydroxyisobutyrate dehydrogenase|nr:NAD(P)-dependent oxidoreductase [Desulfobacterium sp.]
MKKIGWVGTGVMGQSMCMHLLDGGHKIHLYNRTRAKASPLIEKGAVWCDTPAKVAEEGEIIFTIVGFPRDVRSTILGTNGIIEGAKPGTVVVDMTTSSPGLALEIHKTLKARDIESLDAPVSGGDMGARQATLAIMAGGDKFVYDKVLPFFKIMGKKIALMGGPGAGQHTKMSNQILIAGTMIGTVESLAYAYKSGLDLESVIRVIGSGAAGSWSINNLGPRIARGDFDPGFYIKHFIKDMGIALDEAKQMNLALPGLALANQFYVAAAAMGHEELGTQGLYKVFEKMNAL